MSKTNFKRIIILSMVINMLFVNSLITLASPIPTDINKTSTYAREAVSYLFTSNTIKTFQQQAVNFNPYELITRADMIRLVDYVIHIGPSSLEDYGGMSRESELWLPFTDLGYGWEKPFVGAAFRKQIVKGAKLFRPNSNITREEVAVIFMRMIAYESYNEQLEQVANYDNINGMKDKSNISSWAKGAVEIMLQTGLMNGVGNQKFDPKGNATKEQIAVMLYRYIQNRQVIIDKYNKMVYEAPENFKGYITIGTPANQVEQLLGNYNMSLYKIVGYGTGVNYKETDQGRVVSGWDNNTGYLNVKMGRRNPSAPPIKPSSSKEDVIEALGTPYFVHTSTFPYNGRTIALEEWGYNSLGEGNLTVKLRDGKVVGWGTYSVEHSKVFIGNKDAASEGFTVGDTFDDVIRAMGTPNYYYENYKTSEPTYITIRYGGPEVSFNRDLKVIAWEDREGFLKIKDILDPQAPPLTYGSTLEEVFKTMGVPDKYSGTKLYYGYYSYLILESPGITGKVSQWYNYGELKMNMGEKDPEAPALKIGSSFEDVIKAQGTPTIFISFDHISYGGAEIYFKDNKLIKAKNVNSVLKLSEYWKNPSHETFSIGASIDEVTKSLGNPNEISLLKENYKIYDYGDFSELYFDSNNILRAYSYGNSIPELSLGTVKEGATPVSLGMSKQGVIDAMGTPNYIFLRDFNNTSSFEIRPYNEIWSYEGKVITFNDEGKVAEIR